MAATIQGRQLGEPGCSDSSPIPVIHIGPARIGSVTYSKTGATIYYRGQEFRSLKGAGFKANYFDVETGDEYWISGPRKDGADALYATNVATDIDEDVRQEYWTQIRKTKTKPN